MDNPLFEKTIPAKLQSYMACGMPIIVAAKGETERIIQEAGCGICCPIGDAGKLAIEIKNIKDSSNIERMSENAYLYFNVHFEKKKLMDEFDELVFDNIQCGAN